MFGLKKLVATIVGIGALSVPSLALANDHAPRDRAAIQHRHEWERRPDWRRDHYDWRYRHDRWEHERGGHGGHRR